jgi:nucleotide-binding universal stress UspA family protein
MSGNGVVVGVDGSDESRAALRFAVREAHRRSTVLQVISAFESPEHWAAGYGVALGPSSAEVETAVLAQTQRAVDDALRGDPEPPTTQVRAVAGGAARVLLEATRDADLLVVGHRGCGGFTSMMLGSVSLQCVLHARCPVTIVQPQTHRGDPEWAALSARAES